MTKVSGSIFADVILGGRYGDEGKGKVTSELLNSGDYSYCIRFNGGSNAGGSLYHNGKKFTVHTLPVGIIKGMKSIIGPGCVVNPDKIRKELEELIKQGIKDPQLMISDRAHVVLDKHIQQELDESTIGTTKQGIGPCYTDKYARKGSRVIDHKEKFEAIPGVTVIDLYSLFKWVQDTNKYTNPRVGFLFQGVQGLGLDIDHGSYPFVTSSSCGISGVLSSGIPFTWIRNVYAILKGYDTYVGARSFQDNSDLDLVKLQKVGNEIGNTTGRSRQCNWIDLSETVAALFRNNVTHIVINKIDILKEVGVFKYKKDGLIFQKDTYSEWEDDVKSFIRFNVPFCTSIILSGSPHFI